MLYYVGKNCAYVWSQPRKQLAAKQALLRALQRHTRKAVIVQHFGARYCDAIGFAVQECGGRLIDEIWGIYLLNADVENQ
jgi:hypothetical protein